MKRLVDPISNAGAPYSNEDIVEVFQREIYDAMASMMAAYDGETQGRIMSGCIVSGVGPYDISAGVVYLNGTFMRLPAQTGVTFPKYISPKAVTYTQRKWEDGVFRNFVEIKEAELTASAPVSGQYVYMATSTGADPYRMDARTKVDQLQFIIDGGGAAITAGEKGHIVVPNDCVITGWTLLADVSGSIVVDLWKDNYTNFPPTVADTITSTDKPTITTATKNRNLAVSVWAPSLLAGDILAVKVDSAATVQRVTLVIHIKRIV